MKRAQRRTIKRKKRTNSETYAKAKRERRLEVKFELKNVISHSGVNFLTNLHANDEMTKF